MNPKLTLSQRQQFFIIQNHERMSIKAIAEALKLDPMRVLDFYDEKNLSVERKLNLARRKSKKPEEKTKKGYFQHSKNWP